MYKLLFRVSGGMGKNICATAVVKQLKKKYPDSILHVQASYPDVFINMEEVDEVNPLQIIPNFYKYHIDFDVIETEPYIDLKYRQGKEHVIETWCRRLDLETPSEIHGIIKLDESEMETGKCMLANLKFNGPLVAFQYVGGTPFGTPEGANDPTRAKHTRDLPFETAQEVVNILAKQGFGVLQISLPTERKLEQTFQLPPQVLNPRYIFAMLNLCHGGIFIDSFAQHAWNALGKIGAVVAWGGTNPVSLGYRTNFNLSNLSSCNTLHCGRPDTFLMDYQGNGQPWKCPHGMKCMKFDATTIAQTFITNFKEPKKESPKCENSC